MKYRVVFGKDVFELEESVNILLASEWQLQGGELLTNCRAEMLRNNIREPFELTLPEPLWQALRRELESMDSRLTRCRFMGRVLGFDVYVDDSAPVGSFQFTGCKRT